jgi:GMP synthase (glutamine-hydrolysing)
MVVAMAAPNKILIVVTGEPPEDVAAQHGNYVAMMRRAFGGAWQGAYDSIDVRSTAATAAHGAAAIVITGSSESVHTREPWMLGAEAWLADEVRRGTPVLGVCFGHQLLAQALGGEVLPNPAGREMSTVQVDKSGDDPLLGGLDARFAVNACHSDTVTRLPTGTAVLGSSTGDRHQVLRFSPSCYGVQFHPEFDGEVMRRYVDARAESLRAEGLDPAKLRACATDTPSGPKIMENFARLVVRRRA